MNKNVFVGKFVKALNEDNAAIFAGAGLSSGAGFVNWKELLRDVAFELNLEVDKEAHDLISLAQYYCNENGGRGGLNQIITDQFQIRAEITENHRVLSRLPIKTYWTTNYDVLIEKALSENGKNPDVKRSVENLAITLNDRDAAVYKMHGDVSQVHNAIINRDDYERYEHSHSLFTTALKGDLISKTFLFIGFSFSDPNLNYILSRIRISLEGNQRPHYCILKRVNESDDDYEYSKIKQDLQIKDLKRFSINTVLVDEYSEITELLNQIEEKYKDNSIFLSGSADDYGEFSKNDAIELLHSLSYELVKKDYRIISGFGVGVGSYIINGALDCISEAGKTSIKDNLLLRPFPQKPSGGRSIAELWNEYRYKMIKEAGIVIFVFGNKLVDGKLVNSDGIRKEFDIARSMNLKLLPIGITGYQTKAIYEEIVDKFEDYYPCYSNIKDLFVQLGSESDVNEIVRITIEIIDTLRGDN